MKRSEVLFGILRIPLDCLAVAAALLLSYRLREAQIDLIPQVQLLDPAQTLPVMGVYLQSFVVPGMFAFLVVAAFVGMYALKSTKSGWDEMGRIIITSLLWVTFVMAWYFLIVRELFFSRILLAHSAFFIILFVALGRSAIVLLQRACLRNGIGVRMVLSIGSSPIAMVARDTLARDMRYEYLGHVTDLSSLKQMQSRGNVDLVIQTDPNPQSDQTVSIIDFCRNTHISYAFLPPVFADVPHQLEISRLGLVPILQFKPTPLDGWGRVLKRVIDFVLSVILLIFLSPLFILIALLTIIESGFPIFYVSERVGELGRKKIPVLKFRSMVKQADQLKETLVSHNVRRDGPLFKIKRDPRVTSIGRMLRRFDLDELPQLLNVAMGQMSLVGPRPHLPDEVNRYSPYQRRVFAVKPGITGLAQVSGRSDLQFEQEVRLDLQYIEEWSLFLDLWILWRTLFVVLGRGAED